MAVRRPVAPATSRPGHPGPLPFRRAVLRVLLPFASGYYLSYLFRTVGALVSGHMAAELHLGPADLGLLTSAYFLAFALAQLPLGVALDRYGPRRVQAVLLPLATLGAGLFARAHGFAQLALARALIGLGSAAALMAGLKAVALWFPRERLALANGVLVMLGALGAVTATLPAEALLQAADWRALFALLALVTAASAVLIALVVPRRGDAEPAVVGAARAGLLDVYRDRRFWRLAPLSTGCIGTSFAMQGLWAAPWLGDVARLPHLDVVDDLFAMALALSAGALGLGFAADWLRRRGVQPAQALAAVAALSVAAQAALVLRLPVPPFLPWLVLAAAGSATVLSYAALADAFPKEAAGRANAALNVLHIGGAFLIQSGIGVVVGLWGTDAAGHSPAAAYAVAFAFNLLPQCLALAWFAAAPALWVRSGVPAWAAAVAQPRWASRRQGGEAPEA